MRERQTYASIKFIQNHHPPGHDLKGAKPSPRDNHCVQKPSPRDRTGSQKPHPRDIELENFTDISEKRGLETLQKNISSFCRFLLSFFIVIKYSTTAN